MVELSDDVDVLDFESTRFCVEEDGVADAEPAGEAVEGEAVPEGWSPLPFFDILFPSFARESCH